MAVMKLYTVLLLLTTMALENTPPNKTMAMHFMLENLYQTALAFKFGRYLKLLHMAVPLEMVQLDRPSSVKMHPKILAVVVPETL